MAIHESHGVQGSGGDRDPKLKPRAKNSVFGGGMWYDYECVPVILQRERGSLPHYIYKSNNLGYETGTLSRI